ncbi:MAG: hypothetical protein RBR32_11550 [Bacteroidales bacterium]|nr:hypothetical protein [Bacteroidales bacterium]
MVYEKSQAWFLQLIKTPKEERQKQKEELLNKIKFYELQLFNYDLIDTIETMKNELEDCYNLIKQSEAE